MNIVGPAPFTLSWIRCILSGQPYPSSLSWSSGETRRSNKGLYPPGCPLFIYFHTSGRAGGRAESGIRDLNRKKRVCNGSDLDIPEALYSSQSNHFPTLNYVLELYHPLGSTYKFAYRGEWVLLSSFRLSVFSLRSHPSFPLLAPSLARFLLSLSRILGRALKPFWVFNDPPSFLPLVVRVGEEIKIRIKACPTWTRGRRC